MFGGGKQQGVILLGVLVAVVVLGLLSTIVVMGWKTQTQKSKEQELLWRGNQYRRAIESYYTFAQQGDQVSLPSRLDNLIRDQRSVTTVKHLRRLYVDPMTGKDWQTIKNTSGKIIGVKSGSSLEPFKKKGFCEENKAFAGKNKYSEWHFVFTGNSQD